LVLRSVCGVPSGSRVVVVVSLTAHRHSATLEAVFRGTRAAQAIPRFHRVDACPSGVRD